MGNKGTKVETTWECDICDKVEISERHGMPDHWHEIVVAFEHPRDEGKIDWRSYWKGSVCGDCYRGEEKYPDISRERTAKPLLKRIFGKTLNPKEGKS